MYKPAIIAIGYNRPKALERLLLSLEHAKYPEDTEVTLIVSVDKSDSESTVDVANGFEWTHGNKIVNAREENLGLKAHVLACGDYVKEYGSIIVLEDDLYVSENFYDYTVAALDWCKSDERIGGISLYNHLMNVHAREPFEAINDGYDNWYFKFASSWGQAYTKAQWDNFISWYEINKDKPVIGAFVPTNVSGWSDKSWLKYYIKYLIDTNRYFLYPRISFTTNFSEVGEHAVKMDTDVQVPLMYGTAKREYVFSTLDESKSVYDAFFENERLLMTSSATGNVGNASENYSGAKGDNSSAGCINDKLVVDLYGKKFLETIIAETEGYSKDIDDKDANDKNIDGNDSNKECKIQYYLTQKSLPFEIVKSYARAMRPIDANVICEIEGGDIFLYDITKKGNAPKVSEADRYLYDYKAISAKRMTSILKYRVTEAITHK